MGTEYTTRTTCRVCGSNELSVICDYGSQYVSSFVDPGKAYDGPKCPIKLVFCHECTLVQNPHTAPQELLYAGHYWYRSGVTQTMRDALQDVVESAMACVPLTSGDIVLDIGSNDGTLLRHYPDWVTTIGVEPAKNFAKTGAEGIALLINDFWDYETYLEKSFPYGEAKIITACGMFYDLEDPNKFIGDIAKALHPDGVFIAQLMCLKNMMNTRDMGNLVHEHLEFYTLRSLEYLLSKHELEIFRVETNQVNGESYRLFIRHDTGKPISIKVAEAFNAEISLNDLQTHKSFFAGMDLLKSRLVELIRQINRDGKTVWVYGASTKGNTLLQWWGLDDWDIYGAAERSPEKYGKVTTGSNILIWSEAEARDNLPDYFLVLPYAFIEEFVEREKDEEWRKRGGKFIVPLPELRIV